MAEQPRAAAMRERILRTADRLFYSQGIRAVGVDSVAAETGISKRTLYNYFPSKDALIVAYLTRRLHPMPESEKPPAEQILELFDQFEQRFSRSDFRGCPFVNTVAELGSGAHPAKGVALTFKEARRTWFKELLAQLDVADADGIATQLAILIDGAIAAHLVRNDPAMARAAKAGACAILAQAGVSIPKSHAAAAPRQTAARARRRRKGS